LFLFSAFSVIAQERTFPQYNCAVTPPTGWHELELPPQQAFCAAFENASNTQLFMLIIDDKHKVAGEVDDRFISNFEKGVESSGAGKRLSGKFVDIAGLKGYERLGQATIKGREASTIMRVVPADERFYSLQAMRFDGDVSDAPEIQEALATFRFITPPSPPPSRADRTAYRIGTYIAIIMAALIGSIIRERKGRRQQTPPSPPAAQP
jgi:hypothetical protein